MSASLLVPSRVRNDGVSADLIVPTYLYLCVCVCVCVCVRALCSVSNVSE